MSKAAIGKALKWWDNNLETVCDYLERVHNITIDAKGKRKRPSKQQLKERIYRMENVSTVLCDLQRMEHLNTTLKRAARRTLKDDNEDDDEYDNVMSMLKAELALRGKTTNGTSYPLLVKRLLKSLRDEANE